MPLQNLKKKQVVWIPQADQTNSPGTMMPQSAPGGAPQTFPPPAPPAGPSWLQQAGQGIKNLFTPAPTPIVSGWTTTATSRIYTDAQGNTTSYPLDYVPTQESYADNIGGRPTQEYIDANAAFVAARQAPTATGSSIMASIGALQNLTMNVTGDGYNEQTVTLGDGKTVVNAAAFYGLGDDQQRTLFQGGYNALLGSASGNSQIKEYDDAYAALVHAGATPDEANALLRKQMGLDGGSGDGGAAAAAAAQARQDALNMQAWQQLSQNWATALPYMVNSDQQWAPGWEPGGAASALSSLAGVNYNADVHKAVFSPPPPRPGSAPAASYSVAQQAAPVDVAQLAQSQVSNGQDATPPLSNGIVMEILQNVLAERKNKMTGPQQPD